MWGAERQARTKADRYSDCFIIKPQSIILLAILTGVSTHRPQDEIGKANVSTRWKGSCKKGSTLERRSQLGLYYSSVCQHTGAVPEGLFAR